MELRASSLRFNFSWTLSANVINAACQWGIVAVIARLGSASMVGDYAWALAIVMPLTTIAQLQLRPILVTDAAGEHRFADILGIRLGTMLFCAITIPLLAFTLTENSTEQWVLVLVGLSRATDGVSDIFRALFQKLELMRFSGMSIAIRGVSGLTVMVLLLWFTGSLSIGVGGMLLAWVSLLLFFDLPVAHHLARQVQNDWLTLPPRLSWPAIRHIIPMALPLGCVLFLISLQAMIPRLVLEAWHGKESLGYYAALVYPFATGAIAVSALGQAATPRLASYFKTDAGRYHRLLWKLLGIIGIFAVVTIAGSILLGRQVLNIAYGSTYAEHYGDFVLMSFGCAFLLIASFFGFAISSTRRFHIQLIFAMFSCSVSAIASLWLIPFAGIRGAAIAYITTAMAQCIGAAGCLIWVTRKGTRYGPPAPTQKIKQPLPGSVIKGNEHV